MSAINLCWRFYILAFHGIAILVFVVQSTIQAPRTIECAVGKDVVLRWNSTVGINAVTWGLKEPGALRIMKQLIYTSIFVTHISDAVYYKGRLSFIGNLTAGLAWFKISNLTLGDTNYYGAEIHEKGISEVIFSNVYFKLVVIANSLLQVPQPLVRAVGKDAVFQWNSTNIIVAVRWGILDISRRNMILVFMEDTVINPALASGPYKGRISFVGNLTAGRAWFKLTNLTLGDTNHYGAQIREKGSSELFSSVHLKVIDVAPHFTKEPPRILYAQLGEAAIFEWDYISGNKTTDFDPLSPRWEVYSSANGWKAIGADYSTLDWQWKLSSSCPERLRNPTRVSKASTASLVIYNVTIEDSGIYRCNLTLRHRAPITSTATLIVTAQPHFTSPSSPILNVAENKDIKLPCTAVGPPTPNVTWFHLQGVERVAIAEGAGNATLTIINIKRDQNGTYECQAVNNPNQNPVSIQTTINVMYPPEIDHSRSDNIIKSLRHEYTRLRCAASGFPPPNITWYSFNKQPIVQNVTSFPGFSEVSIKIENIHASAIYMCRAENTLGYKDHNLTVIVHSEPNAEQCGKISDRGAIDFVSSPVFVVCIVIIIISIIGNAICIFLITKCYHQRKNGYKSRKREGSDKGVLNMSVIPDTSSPPILAHSVSSSSTEERNETAYEQPTLIGAAPKIHYPYEIPEIHAVDDANASSSLTGTYQELNILQQTARDYQSLQGVRSAVPSRPLCSQTEVDNAYEPLKKTNKPHYEKFSRA